MRFAILIVSALLCHQLFAAESQEKSDEALVAAAEQLIAEGKGEITAGDTSMETAQIVKVAAVAKSDTEVKESEIPVVISAAKTAETKDNSIWRMVAGLCVVAVTAAIGMYASKRWARAKDKGGQKARIEMMHQFHLGPRKSLALVRVSGETMLIGITDHNINMIKAVTLIDDELENVLNKDFNTFLEDEFSVEDVRSAISGARI